MRRAAARDRASSWYRHPATVKKLVLLSIVLATFILPAYAARTRNPRQALLSALGAVFLVELGYAVFLYLVF